MPHPQASRIRAASARKPEPARVLATAVVRVLSILEISRAEAVRVLGLSEASLSRLFGGLKSIDPKSKEGEVSLLLVRLFRSLDTLLGGDETKMKAWLRAKNSYFGQSPIEAIQSIGGFVRVVSYLDAMRGKV